MSLPAWLGESRRLPGGRARDRQVAARGASRAGRRAGRCCPRADVCGRLASGQAAAGLALREGEAAQVRKPRRCATRDCGTRSTRAPAAICRPPRIAPAHPWSCSTGFRYRRPPPPAPRRSTRSHSLQEHSTTRSPLGHGPREAPRASVYHLPSISSSDMAAGLRHEANARCAAPVWSIKALYPQDAPFDRTILLL